MARFPARAAEYMVLLVNASASSTDDTSRSKNDGRSQKFILFIRGNGISGAPVISGTSEFLSSPTVMGTALKKIITNAGLLRLGYRCGHLQVVLQVSGTPRGLTD